MMLNINPLDEEEIKRIILYAVLLFALIMMLTSCGGNYHAKRIDHHLNKLKQKAPELLDVRTRTVTDTIYLSDIQKDTVKVFKENVRDSVVFKDKTVVRYLIKHDTIELDVDCPDQEVITNTVTKTNTVTVKETTWQKVKSLWWLIVIGILLGLCAFVMLKG